MIVVFNFTKPDKESIYGVIIVLLVATFNVLAEQSSRSIVNQINAPFFMMYFSTGWLTGLFVSGEVK